MLNKPYTSAIITVPDNTFANKRNDREIGTAISLITLIGNQIGSHGGNGEHMSTQICFNGRFLNCVIWIRKNVIRPSASVVPTADYGTTLALGLITFFLIHITQFKNLPIRQIWTDMCSPLPPWLPIWFPINVISEIAVPISLSLRLFANVLSGTVMMALVYGLLSKIAIIWPAALHVYFDLFSGAIQTYVFCMLTMTYIGQNYEQE